MEDWTVIQSVLTGSGAALVVLTAFSLFFIRGDIVSKKTYERIVTDMSNHLTQKITENTRKVVKEEFAEIRVDLFDAIKDRRRTL